MTVRETVQVPPGMWRPTDFTEKENEGYLIYRQVFFKNLIRAAGEHFQWTYDWEQTRLRCVIDGGELDQHRDPLELLIYFSPAFSQLFVQIEEFEAREVPISRRWPSVLSAMKRRDHPGGRRVQLIEQKKAFKIRVSWCLQVPLADENLAPFIQETLATCNSVVDEALWFRDFAGAIR
jgi:hypothetical protein